MLRDLAVAIADGGDCVTDLGVMRGQQALFWAGGLGDHRPPMVNSIDTELLEQIRAVRAKARERA